MKIKWSVLFFAVLFFINGPITHALNKQSLHESSGVKVLILTDNIYGGSLNVSLVDSERGRIIESIFNQFKRFGWEIDIISVSDSVSPCKYAESFFGKKALKPDMRLGENFSITNYDVLMVGPGNFYDNLINNPSVHNIVQSALHHDLVIASWCRGLQVLAAAGIIKDKIVIGHIEHELDEGSLRTRRFRQEVYDTLIDLLDADDASIRVLAAEALGDFGNPKAAKALEPLLEDKKKKVAEAAADAIQKLTGKRPDMP